MKNIFDLYKEVLGDGHAEEDFWGWVQDGCAHAAVTAAHQVEWDCGKYPGAAWVQKEFLRRWAEAQG